MIKNIMAIFLFFSLSFSQSIIHNPIFDIDSDKNYNLEASIIGYDGNYTNLKATLFYRSYGQSTYFNDKMIYIDGKFRYTIPYSFIQDAIEYYILIENLNGGIIAFPANSPRENPILVKSEKFISSTTNTTKTLIPDCEILYPEPNTFVKPEEFFISLSYFKMDDIDISKTKIFIDDLDYTSLANIKYSHMILVPDFELTPGEHEVRVIFFNKIGLQYEPIVWKANIVLNDIVKKESFIISQNGNLESNVNNTSSDNILLQVGQIKGDYKIDFDWMKFKTNFLKSSLEDLNEQTKDRLSLDFNTKYFNIKLGDSYPSFSDYTINGNRMRGVNIKFKNKKFDINFLSGHLLREIQGLPELGAMAIIENRSPTFQASGFLDLENPGIIDITRDNYSFKQGLFGLNIAHTNNNNFRFKFEILKVKDKIQSVNQIIDNSSMILPDNMVRHLFSDIFVDYNMNGYYDENEFIGNLNQPEHDLVGSINWDNVNNLSNINTDNFVSFILDTVYLGIFNDEPFDDQDGNGSWNDGEWFEDVDGDGEWSTDLSYNIFQYQWKIEILYENLSLVINDFILDEELYHIDNDGSIDMSDCTYNNCFGDYDINLLESQWEGTKPQDNIIIATDYLHNLSNGSIKLNYGFAFSMLNQNIWNPTLTFENLDQLGAETAEDSIDGKFNGADIPDIVNNLDDFEEIFQTGTAQVPIIPIDINDGITFRDFLTLPSLSVYFDVYQKILGHKINWGFKQIGPEFNSLGNPFLQTNIREQYFSDRTYFFDNKLNFQFKWKRIEDGISLIEDNGETNKYDFIFGFYPGANMPTYNLSVGMYNRTNGIDPLYNPVLVVTEDINENGVVDTLQCDEAAIYEYYCNEEELNSNEIIEEYEILSTQLYQPEKTRTGQFSLSINATINYIYKHRVNLNIYYSDKKDLVNIEKYLVLNNNYYSPRSLSQSYYFGVSTSFSKRLEAFTSVNYNYYDYGYATEYNNDFFQSQTILGFNFTTKYDTYSIFGKINPGVNFSLGRGSTDFSQLSFKGGSQLSILDNLTFNLNLNYKIKFIDGDPSYNNYSILMDLKYKF
tara:strand:+ start:2579 stop:5779 length:3201 start_codon:yes stop_codon:yes gene_type:complete